MLDSEAETLLARLGDPDSGRAQEAFDRLKKEGSTELSPRVQKVLADALARKDPVVRDRACELLLELDDVLAIPAVLEAMIPDLGDDQSNLGFLVSQIIAAQPAAAKVTLLQALLDSRPEARAAAIWGLGYIDDPAILPHLRSSLTDPVPDVRGQAYGTLSHFSHQPDVYPLFLAGVPDPDAEVRINVAVGLGSSDNPEAVAPLIRLMEDPQPGVRHAAAEALGRLRFYDAVAPLQQTAANDTVAEVREAARSALKRIRL